jgi:hypothetical protein
MRNPEGFIDKENIREEELVEQFDDAESIDLKGEQIKIIDIAPEKLKTEVATLMVPGFSATPEDMKDAIIQTAETGRRVISAETPHGIDANEASERKLEAILQTIEGKGLDKVNVITNSEGAIYVTAAAALFPEKFENIVLIEPAGLIGKGSFWGVLERFAQDAREETRKHKSQPKLKYPAPRVIGVKQILSDLFASIKEVNAIAKADITETLKKLHELGIGVSIIHAVDDKVFPMEKVQKMVKANMIDGFYSVKGTHNSIYRYEPFGRAAEAALSALENRQSER